MRSSRKIACRRVQGEAADARLVEAGQAVEDGGLAGAVRADDRGDLAAVGGKGNIVDRDQPAEAHRQMLDREQRCLRGSRSRRVAHGSAAPAHEDASVRLAMRRSGRAAATP